MEGPQRKKDRSKKDRRESERERFLMKGDE